MGVALSLKSSQDLKLMSLRARLPPGPFSSLYVNSWEAGRLKLLADFLYSDFSHPLHEIFVYRVGDTFDAPLCHKHNNVAPGLTCLAGGGRYPRRVNGSLQTSNHQPERQKTQTEVRS